MRTYHENQIRSTQSYMLNEIPFGKWQPAECPGSVTKVVMKKSTESCIISLRGFYLNAKHRSGFHPAENEDIKNRPQKDATQLLPGAQQACKLHGCWMPAAGANSLE